MHSGWLGQFSSLSAVFVNAGGDEVTSPFCHHPYGWTSNIADSAFLPSNAAGTGSPFQAIGMRRCFMVSVQLPLAGATICRRTDGAVYHHKRWF